LYGDGLASGSAIAPPVMDEKNKAGVGRGESCVQEDTKKTQTRTEKRVSRNFLKWMCEKWVSKNGATFFSCSFVSAPNLSRAHRALLAAALRACRALRHTLRAQRDLVRTAARAQRTHAPPSRTLTTALPARFTGT